MSHTPNRAGGRWRPLAAISVILPLVLLAGCSSSSDSSSATASSDTSDVNLTEQTQLSPDFSVDSDIYNELPDSIKESGTVSVAYATGIAPVNFPGDNNDVRGLTPDLANALQQVLGVTFTGQIFSNTASQLLALDSGQVQLTISTNADTAEREQKYTFVDYINANSSIVVQKGNPLGIEDATDLCGKTYGEVKGSASVYSTFQAACEAAGKSDPVLSQFDDAPTMTLALTSGRIDAFIGSDFNTVYQQSQGVAIEGVSSTLAGSMILGFTTTNANAQLAKAVNDALQVLVDNGYYQEALNHWLLGSAAITPGINLATS